MPPFMMIHPYPEGDGTSGDASSDTGSGDSDSSGDSQVDEDKARKKTAQKAFDERNMNRKTKAELEEVRGDITKIYDMLGEMKTMIEAGGKKAKDDVSAKKDAIDKSAETAETLAQIESLKTMFSEAQKKFSEQVTELTTTVDKTKRDATRREVLADLSVSPAFVRLYREGYVHIPDEDWANSDRLVDVLTNFGAFPKSAKNGDSSEEDSGGRKGVARRTDDETGAIHADKSTGGTGTKDVIAKLTKDIEKDFEAVKKGEPMTHERLKNIFHATDKIEDLVNKR